MTSERWVVSDVDDYDQSTAGRPLPSLVSLHFVRSALRRRWWVCVLFALLGLLMAIAYVLTSSTSHVAKAALVMTHDPQVDSSRAMSTDVSLLTTRAVANKTIASLGLEMTPDEFLQSVTADPVSSELLSLTLAGPSSAEAVRRLDTLTSTYLSFRAEQLSAQSNLLVDGMRQRIQELQDEMAQRSKEIDRLANASNKGGTKLSDAIAQRAYVQEQIETLQQSIQDATLRNASVVASSRVVDPAAVDTAGIKRRAALTLASGLIGGAALGCGIVLFFAITSDRLRRRSDVAAALEAPLVSVGRIAPLRKQWLWLSHLRTLDSHRADERQRLVRAIEMELSTPRRAGQLAVACIDNADEVRFAVATAAADLVASGCTVALIDLSERGSLVEVVPSVANSAGSLTVLRPRGVPALAAGPDDLSAVGREDESSSSFEANDVTLVFADLDPAVGADHLAGWTQRVIVALTTGRSSAEKVRTMAELVHAAGLDLRFAALLRTERTDDSSAGSFDRGTPMHLRVDQEMSAATTIAVVATKAEEQEAAADLTLAEEQRGTEEKIATREQAAATEEQVATEKQPADEDVVTAAEQATVTADQSQEQTASTEEEPAEEQLTADHDAAEGEAVLTDLVATEEQEATEEEPAAEELAVPEEEAARVDGLAAADDLQAVAQDEPTSEEQVVEEQQPVDERPATDELLAVAQQTIAGEQSAAADELPAEERTAAEEPAAASEEEDLDDPAATAAQQDATEEAPTSEEQVVAAEPVTTEEQMVAEEPVPTEESFAQEQPSERQVTEEQVALAEDETAYEEPAAVTEEKPAQEEPAPEQPAAKEQVVPNLQPAEGQEAAKEETAADREAIDEEQTAETDDVPDPLEEGAVDGWNLYIKRYPPANGAPALESEEGKSDWSWDWDDLDDLGSGRVSAVGEANYDAAASNSENGSRPRVNAEGDARVEAEQSAGNGKEPTTVEPTTVARSGTRSRTRRRSRHR